MNAVELAHRANKRLLVNEHDEMLETETAAGLDNETGAEKTEGKKKKEKKKERKEPTTGFVIDVKRRK